MRKSNTVGEKKNGEKNRRKLSDRRSPNVIEITHRFAKLVITALIVQVLVIGYVFITEHHGRQVVVNAAREGCERDKLDRSASVILNENILKAFGEGNKADPKVRTKNRNDALDKIEATTAGLETRAAIDCHDRYPDARWIP